MARPILRRGLRDVTPATKGLQIVRHPRITPVLQRLDMIDLQAPSPTALAAAPAVTVQNPPAHHRPTAAIESAVAAGHSHNVAGSAGTLRA